MKFYKKDLYLYTNIIVDHYKNECPTPNFEKNISVDIDRIIIS